ncbi:two-component system sensor histidine kinase/response regulator [Candidatus Megaera polyxenophila]|jgi:K+-sensing histidine kinase KdpD|uniref:sensor histidine kinase n=1 Tax=Candidatus Megaera polyxenophila TaxID=988779 RepID=UPI001CC44AFB|nr:HAMP domain-containing sensor histidine kinase [Candidatus Megaera polyxenophila]MCC8461539.1 HAMP domain-containing histidine kinase [Candidatus Megaera polyxenophila]WHA07280.1 HAMP domain-containing histidine kinase [Candidatus Megaera polyxenophila]BBB56754.1 two-component system sensor histidine kinase/response regulator [Candidatus Megaera polyxenophila]
MQDFKKIFNSTSLFSKVSHELRTPVHGIKGLAEYLRNNWEKLDEKTKKSCMDDIFESACSLEDIVEKLFQLANFSDNNINFHFEKADIIKVIQDAVERNNLFITDKNAVNLFLECVDKEIKISIDQFWIKQLVSNLISNAIKHSRAKNIKVKINSEKTVDSKNMVISVIDDGVGIPSKELGSIFEAFKQGSNINESLKGSGLGLAICKEIVVAHGGEIWAKNNETGGTSVSFSLSK